MTFTFLYAIKFFTLFLRHNSASSHGCRLPACLDSEIWLAVQKTGIKTSYPDEMKEFAALAKAVSVVHDETVELKKRHIFYLDLAKTQNENHDFHAYLADAVKAEESAG